MNYSGVSGLQGMAGTIIEFVLLCLHWQFPGAGHSRELVCVLAHLILTIAIHNWVINRQNLRFQHTLFGARPVSLVTLSPSSRAMVPDLCSFPAPGGKHFPLVWNP